MKIFLCIAALFLYRFIVYICIRHEVFSEYISQNGFNIAGLLKLVDYKWIFTTHESERKPDAEFVRADAEVVSTEKIPVQTYSEDGSPCTVYSYRLKLKFYAGTQTVTTEIESSTPEQSMEVYYNIKKPREVYLPSDPAFREKNERQETISMLYDIGGFAMFVFVAIYFLG